MRFKRIKTRIQKKNIRYLLDGEIETFRNYFTQHKSSWAIDVFNLGLWTGLRHDGILNININRLFTKKIDQEEFYFLTVFEKGKYRDIPIADSVLDIIRRREKWIKDEILIRKRIPTNATVVHVKNIIQRAKE